MIRSNELKHYFRAMQSAELKISVALERMSIFFSKRFNVKFSLDLQRSPILSQCVITCIN